MPVTDPLGAVRSILVAIDDSDASLNAVAAACDVARQTKASVALVHVLEVPRALPLDAELGVEVERAEQLLSRAELVASERKIKIDCNMIQARQVGHAVVDEAVETGTDAIALGLAFNRPFGKFQLNEASAYILEHAPCEVWLFRYAPAGDPPEDRTP